MSESSFEREAQIGGTESVAASARQRPSALTNFLLVSAALTAIGIAFYFNFIREKPPESQPDEAFTTSRDVPGLVFDVPAQKADNRLVMQPPAAPPAPEPPPGPPPTIESPVAAPTTMVPVVSAPAPIDYDKERRERAEAEARLARLRSPMIVTDAAGEDGSTPPGPASGLSSDYKEADANRAFMNAMSESSVEKVRATQNTRTDALIPQGTLIRGVLETAIQSDLPGMVRAVTSTDVWSFDGRRILLPKGTMLTGTYRSGLARGQTRVLIIWQRALRSDGTSVDLGSYGTDDLGRSGLAGDVDNHYLQRFGAAAVLSVVGGASSYVAGLGQNGSSNGGGSNQNNGQNQAQDVISQTVADLANTALRDSIDIPPTVNVDQGAQVIVFVQRDLDFSSLYVDPVKERLNEYRRAKRSGKASPRGNVGQP